jgi:DNA-binding CsgD family transcriptional regulator
VTEVGAEHHRDVRTSSAARELIALIEHDVHARQPGDRLRVVLLHQPDRLRVLLHDEGGALLSGVPTSAATLVLEGLQRSWSQTVLSHAGTLAVERVPGWGVLVLADLPQGADASSVSPLSVRERQVLGLLARGLTDRQVAEELVISPKTVEKHVGAVLRKTGTTSRTAAVVRALEDGWLPPVGRLPAG